MLEQREQIDQEEIDNALNEIGISTELRLDQKGYGTFASKHEILGSITEEYHELIEAIHKHNNKEQVKNELLDLATACHFSISCINSETLDW